MKTLDPLNKKVAEEHLEMKKDRKATRATECPVCGMGKLVRPSRLRTRCKICNGIWSGKQKLKHGHAALTRKTRKKATPTYTSWAAMKSRCYAPKTKHFDRYGGAGITVCEQWRNSFEVFLKDMGERPKGKTIDRINPFGNYEPGNCRWATPKEQAQNWRSNVQRNA